MKCNAIYLICINIPIKNKTDVNIMESITFVVVSMTIRIVAFSKTFLVFFIRKLRAGKKIRILPQYIKNLHSSLADTFSDFPACLEVNNYKGWQVFPIVVFTTGIYWYFPSGKKFLSPTLFGEKLQNTILPSFLLIFLS